MTIREIESLDVRPARIPSPGSWAKNDGGTSSVCSPLWTAAHARPDVLQNWIGDARTKNQLTFRNLAWQAEFEAISKMNERM